MEKHEYHFWADLKSLARIAMHHLSGPHELASHGDHFQYDRLNETDDGLSENFTYEARGDRVVRDRRRIEERIGRQVFGPSWYDRQGYPHYGDETELELRALDD